MGNYTGMSSHYDLIMTSGYYDYTAIVSQLAGVNDARTVLEIGCGTGLILEGLATRRPDLEIIGIDLTPAMLDIADERLDPFPQAQTHLQNITELSFKREFDLAFSYGGVWYFTRDDLGAVSMVSHLRDEEDNVLGLLRLAEHLRPGATLLLGVQTAHTNYARPIINGMLYSQQITELPGGFRKQYSLDDDGTAVMEQTIDYRSYDFEEAVNLLARCGFHYHAQDQESLFLEFRR